MTQRVTHRVAPTLPDAPHLRAVAVRTPTLPPATHTNCYVVGQTRALIVDPASPWPEEQAGLAAALDEAGVRPSLIFLTHHHADHVGGAAALASLLGVPIAAHRETARRLAGRLEISRLVDENEPLDTDAGPLRPLFTPGHAPGHLALADTRSGAILAGDLVASVGTILIAPADDGDMRLYLDSLRRLSDERPTALLPAHGPPIVDAEARLAFYVRHRLEREARVRTALDETEQTLEALLPVVYADVAPSLYPIARQSLLAHLHKLVEDGQAVRAGDRWRRS
jgi:glyoxylase-like metal-dependent hydrolase (beta-lactamase superfamily II)